MQNKKGIFILIVTFLLFLPIIFALKQESILGIYEEYYGWIDFALYLMIFVGLTQAMMAVKFKKGLLGNEDIGSGAKAVSIGLGLAFAISLATWEVKAGFKLFQIAPVILILALFLFGFWIGGWLKSRDKKFNLGELRKAALYFLICVIIIYLFFPSFIYNYLPWPWIRSLIDILIVLAIVILLLSLGVRKGEPEEVSGKRGLLGRIWDSVKGPGRWAAGKGLEGAKWGAKQGLKGAKYAGQKAYDKYKEMLWVSIIPLPNRFAWKVAGRVAVEAGTPLELVAKIEGGSGNYTLVWSVNNRDPQKVIHNETRNKARIKIPTHELVPAVYTWRVDVQDNQNPKKTASNKLEVVIIKNPYLEAQQEKELKKAGITEEKKSIKIASLELEGKSYSNKDIFLLHSEKPISLKCSKEGKFKYILWSLKQGKKEALIGKGESISLKRLGNLLSKKFGSLEGYYDLFATGTDEEGKRTDTGDTKKVYIKRIPEIINSLYKEENKKKIIIYSKGNEYTLEKGEKYFFLTILKEKSQINEGINFIKLKKDVTGINILSSNELSIDTITLKEGTYPLSITLNVKDSFGYEELIPIEIKLNVVGLISKNQPTAGSAKSASAGVKTPEEKVLENIELRLNAYIKGEKDNWPIPGTDPVPAKIGKEVHIVPIVKTNIPNLKDMSIIWLKRSGLLKFERDVKRADEEYIIKSETEQLCRITGRLIFIGDKERKLIKPINLNKNYIRFNIFFEDKESKGNDEKLLLTLSKMKELLKNIIPIFNQEVDIITNLVRGGGGLDTLKDDTSITNYKNELESKIIELNELEGKVYTILVDLSKLIKENKNIMSEQNYDASKSFIKGIISINSSFKSEVYNKIFNRFNDKAEIIANRKRISDELIIIKKFKVETVEAIEQFIKQFVK